MIIDEKGNSRLEIDPKAALEYVMEHFAPSVPGAWASDCIWTVGDALKKAEKRIAELEAELSHSILDATAVLVEGKAKAEARVRELETALTTREVKEAIGRFRGVRDYFEVGDMSAECDGNTLADTIESALAGGKE